MNEKEKIKSPKNKFFALLSGFACLAFFLSLMAATVSRGEDFPVTHGVSAGDVRSDSAVIWSRSDREAIMHLLLTGEGLKRAKHRTTGVKADRDFTGKITLENLHPDTLYTYKVWFSDSETGKLSGHKEAMGQFRTPPSGAVSREVEFAWSGDLAGQNACRDAEEGFPIFKAINALDLDFFIGLGDMIYADNTCEETGKFGNRQIPGNFKKAATLEDYWAHWKYNRLDSGYQKLLAKMAYYAEWDDHEVVNDFGPHEDTREKPPYHKNQHLMPLGHKAFLDYNPVGEDHRNPDRLYKKVRWGKNLEVFFLDNRQYRDSKSAEDNPEKRKTMLGRDQLEWFKKELKSSDARWKFIVSSVPMSVPTGWPPEEGRDGWANFDQETGYEEELIEILGFMHEEGMRNVIWITTDVHFAEVFRYTPFKEDPTFQIYEFITGPLSAGFFPNRAYDRTLGTDSLFFYGPETMDSVKTFEEAKKWMNFGAVRINREGNLTVFIYDAGGKSIYHLKLFPR